MTAYIKKQSFLYSGTVRYCVFLGLPENHAENACLEVFPTRRSAVRYIAACGYTLAWQRVRA